MGMPGPQKINRYGVEFKVRAVCMSEQPGVLIKDVAESLCIHPFMLSKWRMQVSDGALSGKPPALDAAAVAELQRWREVEGKYRQLQMEHDLLNKLPGSSRNKRRSLRLYRGKPASVARRGDVKAARRDQGRLLRLAGARAQSTLPRGRQHHGADSSCLRDEPEYLRQPPGDQGDAASRSAHRSPSRGQAHAPCVHPGPQCAALQRSPGGPESLLQEHSQSATPPAASRHRPGLGGRRHLPAGQAAEAPPEQSLRRPTRRRGRSVPQAALSWRSSPQRIASAMARVSTP